MSLFKCIFLCLIVVIVSEARPWYNYRYHPRSLLLPNLLGLNNDFNPLERISRCRQTVPESKKIAGKCYSVETIARSFVMAQLHCHENGGILAQPPVQQREEFYAKVRQVFPSEIALIEGFGGDSSNIYIGLRKLNPAIPVFEFLASGIPFNSADTNAVFGPGDTDEDLAVAIIPPGRLWERVPTPEVTARPHICEYGWAK